jgi:hypothetical protein
MKKCILLLSLLAIPACVAMTPEEQAALEHDASRPILCRAGNDCAEKWSRAVQWVTQNSDYKLQTASEFEIQTMGPLPNSPSPAYTVTKTAIGNGRYEINFSGGCDNIFACIPSVLQSKARFTNYVLAR